MFCLDIIDTKQIGSIEHITSTTDKNGYNLKKELEKSKIINVLKTENDQLRSISYNNKEEIWTSRYKSVIDNCDKIKRNAL